MLSVTLVALLLSPTAQIRQSTPGQLVTPAGVVCPLERTSVNADVSGFGARVTVVQTFTNPTDKPIEAVYTFPLPNTGAVDRMRMQVGTRVVEGVIKRREEARAIYDAAKSQGQVAGLLDQERPNIFTQSVANIMPGTKVKIEISYVQLLNYEDGVFEFSFPMVVGPRFLGNADDPDKIAPPTMAPGLRTGANIDLTVHLEAGAPIRGMESILHKVVIEHTGDATAVIALAKRDEIPNKDFILRYRTATDTVQSAFLTHMGEKGGFFSLILMPPKAPTQQQIAPKEIIFVIDQSGSQSGFPVEKSKELTLKLMKTLRPGDTFNVYGFADSVRKLWPEPRPNTPGNMKEAEAWIKPLIADGGTQLRLAVQAGLMGQSDPSRLRIVLFNSDGFVGDEKNILNDIRKYRATARMFTFGIGNSVNRFLIDAMSVEGRGDAEYVTLAESADAAVARFAKRLETPVLTDIQVKFDGIQISDVLPSNIPDVFDNKPIVIHGRYPLPGHGKVSVSGKLGGQPWSQSYDVEFPSSPNASAVESLWARKKVDDLISSNWVGSYMGEGVNRLQSQIVDTCLEFGIMSEYTSFVAVEPRVVNVGGRQHTIHVPVPMADGVNLTGMEAGVGLDVNGVSSTNMVVRRLKLGAGRAARSQGGLSGGGGSGSSFGLGLNRESNEQSLSPEQLRRMTFEAKIAKPLRSKKGKIEVQIWLSSLDDKVLAKLKTLGVTVDASDAKLKVVFGTVDAHALEALAQLDVLQRVNPLED